MSQIARLKERLNQIAMKKNDDTGSVDITGRKYSKTYRSHSKTHTKIRFSKLMITKCKSKVLQNAAREHSAILSTCIKLPLAFLRPFFCLFLSGHLRRVSLYNFPSFYTKRSGQTLQS